MGISFSERQAQTIATAITTLATVVILLAVGVLVWLLAAFLGYFSSVFLPLAVGAILALVCRPYYDLLRQRLKMPAAAAVLVVLLTGLLPLVGFGWFFGQLLVSQAIGFFTNLPQYIADMRAWGAERLPRVVEMVQASGVDEQLRATARGQQDTIVAWLQQLGSQMVAGGLNAFRGFSGLAGWAILPVYFAYFLTADISLDAKSLFPFFKEDTRKDAFFLLREFVNILVAFFRGQLIIAFLQGVLYAVGFSVIGLKYGFVIGMLMGMLNVIPYLGMMIGLAISLPVSLFQEGGGVGLAVASVVVIIIVQQIEGWVLTPRIMGDRTGLHFMTIIVAIFFWGQALGGLTGMILAIPLTAFLASVWRMVREKYVTEIV